MRGVLRDGPLCLSSGRSSPSRVVARVPRGRVPGDRGAGESDGIHDDVVAGVSPRTNKHVLYCIVYGALYSTVYGVLYSIVYGVLSRIVYGVNCFFEYWDCPSFLYLDHLCQPYHHQSSEHL